MNLTLSVIGQHFSSFATAGLVAGSLALTTSAPLPTVEPEVLIDTGVPEAVELKEVKPEEEPNTTQEEENKQADTASQPSAPQQPSRRSAGTGSQASQPSSVPQFSTITEAEQAYLGYCPKDVPSGVWSSPLSPSIALGINGSMSTAQGNTPNGRMVIIWNAYKQGQGFGDGYRFVDIERLGINTGCDNCHMCHYIDGRSVSSTSGYYFTLNWSTLTVYVSADGDSHINLPANVRAEADNMASSMTSYLRWLNSSYATKCGG